MKKKIVALLTLVTMMLTMSIPAFAATNSSENEVQHYDGIVRYSYREGDRGITVFGSTYVMATCENGIVQGKFTTKYGNVIRFWSPLNYSGAFTTDEFHIRGTKFNDLCADFISAECRKDGENIIWRENGSGDSGFVDGQFQYFFEFTLQKTPERSVIF